MEMQSECSRSAEGTERRDRNDRNDRNLKLLRAKHLSTAILYMYTVQVRVCQSVVLEADGESINSRDVERPLIWKIAVSVIVSIVHVQYSRILRVTHLFQFRIGRAHQSAEMVYHSAISNMFLSYEKSCSYCNLYHSETQENVLYGGFKRDSRSACREFGNTTGS